MNSQVSLDDTILTTMTNVLKKNDIKLKLEKGAINVSQSLTDDWSGIFLRMQNLIEETETFANNPITNKKYMELVHSFYNRIAHNFALGDVVNSEKVFESEKEFFTFRTNLTKAIEQSLSYEEDIVKLDPTGKMVDKSKTFMWATIYGILTIRNFTNIFSKLFEMLDKQMEHYIALSPLSPEQRASIYGLEKKDSKDILISYLKSFKPKTSQENGTEH